MQTRQNVTLICSRRPFVPDALRWNRRSERASNGSPLRKRVNQALLAIYEDGTYEAIYAKWFSPSK